MTSVTISIAREHSTISPEISAVFNTLDPNENEIFTQNSWQTLFNEAVSKKLPSLTMAVTECTGPQGKVYRTYSASHFKYHDKYHANKSAANRNGQDPYTKLPIDKVHFFEMDCFKATQQAQLIPNTFNVRSIQHLPQPKYVKVGSSSSELESLFLAGSCYPAQKDEHVLFGMVQWMVAVQLYALALKTVNAVTRADLKSKALLWGVIALPKVTTGELSNLGNLLAKQRFKF